VRGKSLAKSAFELEVLHQELGILAKIALVVAVPDVVALGLLAQLDLEVASVVCVVESRYAVVL
jgi:hypothetical protein